jgi:ABC-type transporter Mla subunit MlaD
MESQLKQAQEELAVQTEVLERLREQLQDKIKETDKKLVTWKDQTSGVIGSTLSEISAQMNQTNDLMRRLELLKAQTSDCNDQGAPTTVAPSPSLPELTTYVPPSPEPQPTQVDTPTLPLPEPTTITFAPPAPSG